MVHLELLELLSTCLELQPGVLMEFPLRVQRSCMIRRQLPQLFCNVLELLLLGAYCGRMLSVALYDSLLGGGILLCQRGHSLIIASERLFVRSCLRTKLGAE